MNKFIQQELKFGANNYKSFKVCIEKATGVFMFSENKRYYDFLSCYSAANQGHCHPRIINALNKQSKILTLTSRAFHNNQLGPYMEYMSKTFNFDKVLPMNTGVEAGETAIKIARKWGYEKKGVKSNKATILFAENNFWGRTISACSSSTDPSCYTNFGPYMEGMDIIEYNNVIALEDKLMKNPNIVAYMLEPIQGEAGIIIPTKGYLKKVKEICNRFNVLMIADEVQTGLGRTGQMLACDHENVKPDILCLGKALSGGVLPISAVLADNKVMDCITPGTHGSTFGGNPLAAVVATEALKVIEEENLCKNSQDMGEIFRNLIIKKDFIKDIRGKGLMNAIEFENKEIADLVCNKLAENNILTKSTHDTILRMTPPLIIKEFQMKKACEIINNVLSNI